MSMADDIRELRVQTVSKCTKDGSMYLAILQEREGKRILPVLIDRNDAVHLLKKMIPDYLMIRLMMFRHLRKKSS